MEVGLCLGVLDWQQMRYKIVLDGIRVSSFMMISDQQAIGIEPHASTVVLLP